MAGKVFLIVTDDPDERIITVKSEPEQARALRHSYPSIGQGRYLDKAHWISLFPDGFHDLSTTPSFLFFVLEVPAPATGSDD